MIIGMLSLVIVAAILSILAFNNSNKAIIEVEAMKRSTHQITYIDPTTQNFSSVGDQTKEDLLNSSDLDTL